MNWIELKFGLNWAHPQPIPPPESQGGVREQRRLKMPRKLLCSARAVASGAEEVEPGVRWIRASPARADAARAGAGATP